MVGFLKLGLVVLVLALVVVNLLMCIKLDPVQMGTQLLHPDLQVRLFFLPLGHLFFVFELELLHLVLLKLVTFFDLVFHLLERQMLLL